MSIDIDNLPCENMTFIMFILMLSHIYYFYGPVILSALESQYWALWEKKKKKETIFHYPKVNYPGFLKNSAQLSSHN